jgi:hypothetical protein
VLVSSAAPSFVSRPPGRMPRLAEPPGYVFLRHGTRADVWYAKYRLPDGRQVKEAHRAGLPRGRRALRADL